MVFLGENPGQPRLTLGLLAHVADAVLLALVAEPVRQGRQALRQVIFQGDEQVCQGAPQTVVLPGVDLQAEVEDGDDEGKKNRRYMLHPTFSFLPLLPCPIAVLIFYDIELRTRNDDTR